MNDAVDKSTEVHISTYGLISACIQCCKKSGAHHEAYCFCFNRQVVHILFILIFVILSDILDMCRQENNFK